MQKVISSAGRYHIIQQTQKRRAGRNRRARQFWVTVAVVSAAA
jgi:hypothetical protein